MEVAFLCSNDTHVRMFVPVAAELERRGQRTRLLGLDAFYGQGASTAAAELGVAVEDVPNRRPRAGQGFYRRPVPAVWRDVIAARPAMRSALLGPRADVLVLGNDFGLLEKLGLATARRAGIRVVLVQDGRLTGRPRPGSAGATVLRAVRGLVSPALRAARLPYLASSEYGTGGADAICASGPRGAALLRRRSGGRVTVVETGQPRYDGLAGWLDREADRVESATVAMFTTPFAAANLGAEAQAAQEGFAAAVNRALRETGGRLLVKPHPREDAGRYRLRLGTAAVLEGPPAAALARCHLAVIGTSSVLDEAAILSRPVAVPGRIVHTDRFDHMLPDPAVYPRVESAAEVVAIARRVTDPNAARALVERQRAAVERELHFDQGRPAADAIADVILDVGAGQRAPATR